MVRSWLSLALFLFFMPSVVWAQKEREREGDPNSERQRLRRPDAQRPNGQTPGRPDGPMAGGGPPFLMMAKLLPVMMALDLDQDGSLSANEIEHASKALLKLDKDGDGLLSVDELKPDLSKMQGMMTGGFGGPGGAGGQGPAGMMMSKMLEQRDANNNGKLEGDEIPERMRDRLSQIDKDGDGAISKSELERASAMMGDRGGPGQRGKSDSDGSGVKPKRPGKDN